MGALVRLNKTRILMDSRRRVRLLAARRMAEMLELTGRRARPGVI
jgi:hypothetical protein